jgi:5,10-methylenetetrahydromethanopterin reductase
MNLAVASLGRESSDEYLEHVRSAEELGFDGFFHNDAKWRRDPFSRLGAAAARTTRIGLGTSVVDPYTRHPAVTAQALATLAELAPGRITAVIGSGSHFDSLPGYRIEKPLVAMRESVGLMRTLWAGETATVDGEIVRFQEGRFEFTPPVAPSLWIAARGEKMLALGGEIADGVLVGSFATPPGIEYARGHIEAGLDRSGRGWDDVRLASWLYLTLLEDEADSPPDTILGGIAYAFWSSRAVLTALVDELADDVTPAFRSFLETAPAQWRPEILAELQTLLPRGLLDSLAIIGTPAQVIEKLAALDSAGVKQAIFWPFPRTGQTVGELVTELGRTVLPAFSGARA